MYIVHGHELQESLECFYEECRLLARAMAPEQNGAFFLGETFSLVDIALAPFWQRFLIVGGHYRGLKFPDKEPEFRRLRVRRPHHPHEHSACMTHGGRARLQHTAWQARP